MFRINQEAKNLEPLEEITFSAIGAKERYDIQEWIDKDPGGILENAESSLLMLAKENPVNQNNSRGIRSDLLALDRSGNLVVIELKRDEARGDIDWQAIKYAARYSRYGVAEIVQMFADRQQCSPDSAKKEIFEFLAGDSKDVIDDDEIGDLLKRTDVGFFNVRIILVAREFHPEVASAALWLRDSGVSVSCVRLTPYKDHKHQEIYLVSERIIPLPETADYIDIANKRTASKTKDTTEDSQRRVNQKNWSNEVPNLSKEELKARLQTTLSRPSSLTPRLKVFLGALVEKKGPVKREDMKSIFVREKIAEESGLAGRYLSNISQFINKRDNDHLRQLIEFTVDSELGEGAGARKDDYKLRSNEYIELVEAVLRPGFIADGDAST